MSVGHQSHGLVAETKRSLANPFKATLDGAKGRRYDTLATIQNIGEVNGWFVD